MLVCTRYLSLRGVFLPPPGCALCMCRAVTCPIPPSKNSTIFLWSLVALLLCLLFILPDSTATFPLTHPVSSYLISYHIISYRLISQPMLTEESIAHIKGIVAEHGSDAWWEMETADLLPPVRHYTALRQEAEVYITSYDRSCSGAWGDHGVGGVGMC